MYSKTQTRIRGGFGGNYAAGSTAIDPRSTPTAPPVQAQAQPADPRFAQDSSVAPPPTSAWPVSPPSPAAIPPEYSSDESCYEEEMDQGPSYAGQICKIGGKGKFLSFHNELNLAARPGDHEDDYAALHGQGGKKHAVRSRIEARMCDYSSGTGDGKSINVRYNLEPYYLLYLLEVVKAAINGNLDQAQQMQNATLRAQADGIVVGWIKAQYQPSYNDLVGLHKMLAGNASTEPIVWSDFKEKNNPYPQACKMLEDIETKKTVEHTLVSTFQVQYNPTRNYQWTITISNFWAPTSRQSKGTCSHNSKRARDGQKVSIMVTTADLYAKLTNVEHFISTWERRAYPMLNAMCIKKEQDAETWRQQQKNK